LRLKNNSSVDPTTELGGQRGLQDVRVLMGGKIVADVPIDFSQMRDWSGVTINSESGRVVVKVPESAGFRGTYSMYVEKGDTNRFRLCTKATSLDEVNSECAGSVVFAGPYPQTISIDSNPITVSVAVVDGVSYW